MAEIVSVIALSHAPGLTGWLDKAPKAQQDSLVSGFTELGRKLRAARPDVIIGFANDHVLNLPLDNTPDFCVGTAQQWKGPAEWFRDWVAVPDYTVAGHPSLAKALVREGARQGIGFAFKDDLLFDDNWSVPLLYLTPDYDVPLIPIHMNCIVPPLPTPVWCHEVGRKIAEIVRAWPGKERVAIMGTGGLSHDPGGPKYFQVDEKFDRWFLGLLEEGDPDQVLDEVTLPKMAAAGDGGTTELLSWIVAMGAAGRRRAHTVCYEPALELRCGMGCVYWDMGEEER
jgi:aromatic ring-opening dioxygenase catalytic subunit (LigB family)